MKIRHSLSTLVVLAILFQPLSAALAQQPPKAGTKHCLWKVQGKTTTAYLFGSIHFLKKEFYPLPKPIEDAYANSQVVMFETDFEEMQTPQTQLKMLQQGRYPEGETLKQHLSKETYAKLQSYLTETVGTGEVFDTLKPWMVAIALLGVELQKLGFDPQQGVDKYFFGKATQDKKTILPLETVDFQVNLLSGLTQVEGEAMLKETLQEISNFKKMLGEMIDAWKNGDAKALDTLTLDVMRQFPDVHKKLLLDRNKDWSSKLEKQLAAGKPVFVVVGAAHLVGKDSLVDLLAKKGYKIEQQ